MEACRRCNGLGLIHMVLILLSMVLTAQSQFESDSLPSDPPKITIPPFNHKVPFNQRVTLFCQASGHPAPEVYWMKNGRRLNEKRNRYISVTDYTSALMLESVDNRQAGTYSCMADNGVGDPASANATLSVYADGEALPEGYPRITEVPDKSTMVVEMGFPMRLKCSIVGVPAATVVWYKDKIPVDVDSSNRVQVISDPARPGSHDLHIRETEDDDDGSYECMGRNRQGTVYSEHIRVYVRVRRYAPTFTIRPDPVNHVMSGKSLNLTCVAVGSPMPYVWWKKLGGERLGDPDNTPIGRNVLTLTNIQESANYSCTAVSDLGTIVLFTEVKVQALPDAPRDLWVYHISSKSANIQWSVSTLENQEELNVDPNYVVQFRSSGEEEWSERGEDEINSELSFTLLGLQPYSLYYVRVIPYIEYGRGTPSIVKMFRTAEAAPESAPYEITAKAMNRNKALVQWRAPLQPNGEIEGYDIYYTLAENAADRDINAWSLKQCGGSVNLVLLDGLLSNERYAVVISARNRIGTGPRSQPVEFIMVEGVPLAPANLQAIAKTSNSITLSWEEPDGAEGILSYEIYINNSRTRQQTVRNVMPPRETFVLEDLYPNTIYNIRITARSIQGEGPHTNTIQVKTNESEPSAPPHNIRAQAPVEDASTVLRVSWEPPSLALANGHIAGYKLFYLPESQTEDSSASIIRITNATQNSVEIEGLDVWTKYKVWMKAYTSVGDGPASLQVIGRTGQSVPESPRGFSAMALNSSSVLLTWRRPTDREAKGIIRGYQIFRSELGENGERITDPILNYHEEANATNFTVTGLHARTRYSFQIRAFTIAGDGDASGVKSVETLGAVPTAPRNLRLEIVENNPPRVKVTWTPPREAHGALKSYRLMWGKRGDDILASTASIINTRFSYIAQSMNKGTEYEFRLQAQNDENYGEVAVDYIKTEDGVPAGSPKNIRVAYVSDTSARVSWDEIEPGLRNGQITMYQVRYQDKDNSIDLRADNTSETSIILEELTPSARYFIQVVAFTSAGAGPTSYRQSYNSRQTRPPAPLALTGERIDATTIKVSWQAPPAIQVTQYEIHYTTQVSGDGVDGWESVQTSGPVNTYLLTNLDRSRAYALKVQAINAAGEKGLMSEEAVVNKVLPPTYSEKSVRSLSSNRQTSTSITIDWLAPIQQDVLDYKIEYTGKAQGTSGIVHSDTKVVAPSVTQETLKGLRPDYVYTIEISVKYDGENSYAPDTQSSINVATQAVEAPRLKKDTGSAVIHLSREQNDFDEIFIIVATSTEKRQPSEIRLTELQVPKRQRRAAEGEEEETYIAAKFTGDQTPNEFVIGDGQEYGEYVNKELAADKEYKSFVKVVIDDKEYSSQFSPLFTSQGAVTSTDAIVEPETEQPNMLTLFIGPIGGVVVIILVIIIIVVVIRRKKTYNKEEAPEPTKIVIDQPPTYPNDPVELRRMQFSTPGMQNHPPIPITQLSAHIDQLRAHDNLKFSQEYESIEPGQQFTWDNSNLEYNKPKNRYANVIAYDHSRVVLQPMDGMPGSDYINANYMDGYRKQNAYISTQGPLPETFGDFWRMVWEQRSATVVMMTKLEERARVKCDAYWPSEGTEMYGPIIVTLTDCMELATYTVRTFQVERDGWAEKREVRQFQFTAWPDHGVPDYPTPLLIFMRRVKAATPSDSGPMVVHCSAGVGRTGAFIVIDAMLERIKHEKTVDIYGHVTCLRAQRNYMVQTEDQYIFIHDALLEAVLSGNTEIPARNLYTHIQKLTQPDGAATGMEKEFKTLSNTKINPSRFASANLAVNKFKNRLVNVLPYESNRVCLQPIRGVDGSDYINASFIDGYRFKKAYVATQGPLAETAEDFWRMMWEHNSTIVVMLTKLREMGREKCHQYWPDSRSARYQYFVVDPHAEYNMPEYTLREFKVTDARDGQSRTIRLFQFNDWPEQGVPKSGLSFIQFIGQVHKTKEQFGQEGPITVHCSAGVGRTGVFISLSIILERMRYEGVVDMFQTVKMLRTQRQGMVQTDDQYAFCYQAALEHLASFDHY